MSNAENDKIFDKLGELKIGGVFKKVQPFYTDRLNHEYSKLKHSWAIGKVDDQEYNLRLWGMIRDDKDQINYDAMRETN